MKEERSPFLQNAPVDEKEWDQIGNYQEEPAQGIYLCPCKAVQAGKGLYARGFLVRTGPGKSAASV